MNYCCYIISENYEKGAEYSRLAAKRAEKKGSLSDAIPYVKRSVASLESLKQTDDVEKRLIDSRTILGLYFLQTSDFVAAKEAIGPIVDRALQSGYKRRLSQIYAIIGTYNLYVEEDFPKAYRQLQEALKISNDINNTVSLFFANYWLGIALSHNCEFEKAFYYLEKALDINIAANSLWGISFLKNNLSLWVYHFQGRINLGYQTSHEAVRIAEESGDTFSKAGYGTLGISCFLKGLFKESEEHCLKSADLCEAINFLHGSIFANFNLGETYFEIGQLPIDLADPIIYHYPYG